MGTREYWNKRDGHYHDLHPSTSVPLRIDPNNPLDFSKPEGPLSADAQRLGLNLIQELNTLRGVEYPHDPAMAARRSYELAFRMQQQTGSAEVTVEFAPKKLRRRRLCMGSSNHIARFAIHCSPQASRQRESASFKFNTAAAEPAWDT